MFMNNKTWYFDKNWIEISLWDICIDTTSKHISDNIGNIWIVIFDNDDNDYYLQIWTAFCHSLWEHIMILEWKDKELAIANPNKFIDLN